MLIYSHLFYNEIHICPTRVRHTEGEGNYLVASRDIDAGEVTLLIHMYTLVLLLVTLVLVYVLVNFLIHIGLAIGVGLCLGVLDVLVPRGIAFAFFCESLSVCLTQYTEH